MSMRIENNREHCSFILMRMEGIARSDFFVRSLARLSDSGASAPGSVPENFV